MGKILKEEECKHGLWRFSIGYRIFPADLLLIRRLVCVHCNSTYRECRMIERNTARIKEREAKAGKRL